jgi:tetratricopeptide (TPR) repeat protein
VGAGGAGKSSLARAWLARQTQGVEPGRALWIELHDLDSLQGLVARWAAAMALDIGDDQDPRARLDRLAAAAPPGPWWVVLDNAEHLLQASTALPPDSAADLAVLLEGVLAQWPGLRLLVTSRLRLHAEAEWVMPLGGMPVPDAASAGPDAAAGYDSVRLFEQAARRALPGFALGPELPQVLALIRAVEGLPLAIELAAGWVRLMPLAAVVQELAAAPMALERSAHLDHPARPEHGRLRDVAERTLALLAPAERAAAEGASVFGGGFTRAAAQAVLQAGLSVLSSLCDKSLLRFDGQRFRFHPWILALLAERLALDPSRRLELLHRHAHHFADQALALLPHVHGDPRPLIHAMQADDANFRIAWQHAVAQGLHAQVRDLALPWATFHDLQGRLAEATALFRPALRQQPADALARAAQAAVRRGLAGLLLRQGLMADAATVAAGGVALGGTGPDTIACLLAQGAVCWDQGDPAAAHAHFEQARAHAEAAGDRLSLGLALGQLGLSHGDLGRPEAAMRCLHEALAIHRELGHVMQTVTQLAGIAGQHVIQQELPQARPWLDEAMALARQHGLVREQVQVSDILIFVLAQTGAHAAARELAMTSLPLAVQTGMNVSRTGLLQTLARIEMADRRFAEGHRVLAQTIELARRHQLHAAVMRAVRTGAELLAAEGRAREAARLYLGLQRSPLATPWDLESFERLLARLPPAEVEAARPEAVGGTLDELVAGWRRSVGSG